jgi:hypothetical protein
MSAEGTQPIRTWTLNPRSGLFHPLPRDRDAARVTVIELEPVLDLLERLKAEVGRDWMYLSTPLSRDIEALLS